MKLNVVILAGGQGSRMQSNVPKSLHKIAGKAMLERVFETASSLLDINKSNIYVVYGDEKLKKELHHLKVKWVLQKEPLGTGHAVLQVAPFIEDDSRTLILYGDVPLITKELLQNLLDETPMASFGLITAVLENPNGFGRIIRDENKKIVSITEQKDLTKEQIKENLNEINTGITLCPSKLLKEYLNKITNNNAQKEYYLTDVIAFAKGNEKIVSVVAKKTEEILGINNKYQLALQERFYQRKQAKQLMLEGITLLDPSRFDLRGEIEFGKDVVIDANVIIKGKVVLGDNVQIHANSIIEDSIIENNCSIGPFARIRPGTHIKANAQIGNFVELKKTQLGENSKANHLTYLGDAKIGCNVNIGAGTITCNYDGKNKYPTEIGDNAFIGSDTKLVAPVKIGKNATIGAGSTITEDAPDDTLTLARTRQVTVSSWKRKDK